MNMTNFETVCAWCQLFFFWGPLRQVESLITTRSIKLMASSVWSMQHTASRDYIDLHLLYNHYRTCCITCPRSGLCLLSVIGQYDLNVCSFMCMPCLKFSLKQCANWWAFTHYLYIAVRNRSKVSPISVQIPFLTWQRKNRWPPERHCRKINFN